MKDLLLCLRNCNPVWNKPPAPVHHTHKTCTVCEEHKPIGEFYLKENKNKGSLYRDGWCKKCRIAKTIARQRAV